MDRVANGRDPVADADHEQRREVARQLHEADRVDRAAELAVGVGQVQDRRCIDAFGPAVADEDLELVADVLRVEVVDFGRAER